MTTKRKLDCDEEIRKATEQREWPEMKNKRVFDVIEGKKPDEIPVWIMRQAGRYLPEFREIRQTYDFLTLIHTPELAKEVTMMPIRRFKMDAAIIFSDILTIPEALGMKLVMNPGPTFPEPLTAENYKCLLNVEGVIDRLKYVAEALTLTRLELDGNATLFGFSGAPWTLMCFMIDGKSTPNYLTARQFMYKHPDEAKAVVEILTDVIIDYCVMQAKAGAQVIQIFDTLAGILPRSMYKLFLPYICRIRKDVRKKIEELKLPDLPMVIFAKDVHYAYNNFVEMGYEVISIDYTEDPSSVLQTVSSKVVLQGNLDPCALFSSKEEVANMVNDMLGHFEGGRLIANLGHGILPETPLESVEAFVKAIRNYRKVGSTLKGVS